VRCLFAALVMLHGCGNAATGSDDATFCVSTVLVAVAADANAFPAATGVLLLFVVVGVMLRHSADVNELRVGSLGARYHGAVNWSAGRTLQPPADVTVLVTGLCPHGGFTRGGGIESRWARPRERPDGTSQSSHLGLQRHITLRCQCYGMCDTSK